MAEKHIYVFGDIGWEVRLSDVAKQTEGAVKGEDSFIVHIHSPGGDVSEGFAIHDHIRSFGVPVETRIEGLCASIATVIALAGDTRTMTENSTFFVHNPWSMAAGDADDMQRMTDELRAVEDRLAGFYAKVTGQEKEKMLELMKAETSMTADEAKTYNFITEVVQGVKAAARLPKQQIQNPNNNSIMSDILNKLDAGIKAIQAKLGIKAQATEPKAMSTTLEDGTEITINTEAEAPEVGDAVTLSDGSAAPDGEHTLADGTVITTEGGVITAVAAPAAAGDDKEKEMQALKDENAALQAKVQALEGGLETANAALEQIQAKLNQKFTAPVRTTKFNRATPEPEGFTKDSIKATIKKAAASK
jgi:ATP-dependent Clp endopeptidase proteolytic subunit ClpP